MRKGGERSRCEAEGGFKEAQGVTWGTQQRGRVRDCEMKGLNGWKQGLTCANTILTLREAITRLILKMRKLRLCLDECPGYLTGDQIVFRLLSL